MAVHQFQTEINQLLHLMIHSLYSNKEIFLRELVSNASDALDKLQYLTLTDEKYKALNFSPRIDISFDAKARTLVVSDNGIGMNDEDMVENLGTIAKSGTKSFVEKLTGDAKKDSNLIGQFGVGFYSAFMVADTIEVISKKAGEEKAYHWKSSGQGEYEITEDSRESHGTTVTLHLKEEEKEFADAWRIEAIVKKYSNHIPFAIYLTKPKTTYPQKEGEEPKTEIVTTQINAASALWRRNKAEITPQEYEEFYATLSHDSEKPLLYIHTKAEGTQEYTTLFYIPSKAPFDLYRADFQPGVKLYIKRVFITDSDRELMPTYLRFLRGIIDSEDLPLNVSREILQENRILANIKSASVKRVLSELAKLQKENKEKYAIFTKEFGNVLKEGLYNDFANREKILELLPFHTLNANEPVTIEEFVKTIDPEKKEIYYITAKMDLNMLKNSPQLERFKAKGLDVLLLNEEIDTIVFPMVHEYKGYRFVNVADAKFEESEAQKREHEEVAKAFEGLIKELKEALGDKVKSVELSHDLTTSPVAIKEDRENPDFMLAQMMRQFGKAGEAPKIAPILLINPKHELIAKLKDATDKNLIADAANVLLEQAKLFAGEQITDPADFIARVGRIMARAL